MASYVRAARAYPRRVGENGKMATRIQTLRLSDDTLERADALLPRLTSSTAKRVDGVLTRAEVLRLAILRGLDALEAETTGPRRARTPKR